MAKNKKVKRGRDISNLRLFHTHPWAKTHLKKYSWICTICGKEYIAKEDAEICYNLHESELQIDKIPPIYREDIERLRESLNEAHGTTITLLGRKV